MILIRAEGRQGEDYNLALGKPVSTRDLARLVAQLHVAHAMSNSSVEISAKGESFTGDVTRWFRNIDKVRKLGFFPIVSICEGVLRTVTWFQLQDAMENRTAGERSAVLNANELTK